MERTKYGDSIIESDKVWVSVSSTINLGNYENVKIDLGYSRSIKNNENPSNLRNEMIDELIDELVSKKDEIRDKLKN